MASECTAHQGMHLFEDFSILEIVDEHNRPVPPGEQGEKALLTVLFRRTQPLIRYEISDLIRTSKRECCDCGSPFALIENVEGRTNEMLFFPSPDGGEEKVNPYLFFPIFYPLPVSAWQVVQELDGLHVFLAGVSDELQDEQVIEAFQKALGKRGVIVPTIQIHRVDALSKSAGGKTPIAISHVPCRAS